MQINSSDRIRLVGVAFFIFSLFCALIIKFYQIQILEGEKWTRVANMQHQHIVVEPFMRGSFYSNTSIKTAHPENEQAFVVDVPKFHLYIDPKSVPERLKEKMAEKILYIFSLQGEEAKKIRSEFYKKSRSRKLISWLDIQIQEKVMAWFEEFAKEEKLPRNALFFVKDYKRSYPFQKMLGALLHTVQDQKDPLTFQALPTGGLEMQFNEYLKGKLGKRIIYRSPRNSLAMGRILEYPEDGADVYLTINHYLQAICEEVLEKGVKNAQAKSGWVVLMEPHTGEILALAQYPYFDVTEYPKYFNDPELLEHTRIKAITDAFEPGSIFKPITFAIGLNANEEMTRRGKEILFDPDQKMATSDGSFPKTRFKLKDGRKHQFLNLPLALQKSSNIYPGKVVQNVIENLGDHWFRSQICEVFGFGMKTNVEIPAESGGLVPRFDRLHPNKTLEWSVPTPYSLAIGHNIMANTLQMARAFCIISNGGFDVQPTILRKIVKGDKILVNNTNRKQLRRLLSEQSTKKLIRSMKFVTKYGGTSPKADIVGYSEAGKTGTSEKIIEGKYSHSKYISTFAGFSPAENPRFVMVVVIDEPEKKYIEGVGKNYHGGVCAAPIFQQIGWRVLEYLGVEPDDPLSFSKSKQADWIQETKDLRELYNQWNPSKK